ncbi:unnamed protein product [Sphenostylis stenocarpa]|uniref:Uncharacterized protein n=1 Tax=Sphenostylis stenocarpa TaxID=92480 RepID=A0AA86SQB8_9FABA|nr:unnamed protein product [Sphenostylis stenocarpa]
MTHSLSRPHSFPRVAALHPNSIHFSSPHLRPSSPTSPLFSPTFNLDFLTTSPRPLSSCPKATHLPHYSILPINGHRTSKLTTLCAVVPHLDTSPSLAAASPSPNHQASHFQSYPTLITASLDTIVAIPTKP